MSRGFLYLAVQHQEFAVLAHFSILSLRQQGVEDPICVLTDRPSDLFDLDGVTTRIVEVEPIGFRHSRHLKTQLDELTPFDQTVFLDCDVLCLRDPAGIWLDGDSFGAALDEHATVQSCTHARPEEHEYTSRLDPWFPQWNTGVLMWRGNKRLWGLWNDEWMRFGDIDQLAFARAVRRLDAPVVTLPDIYNHQGSSLADAQRDGAVFWHPWHARVACFRQVFGGAFDAQYRDWCELRAPAS